MAGRHASIDDLCTNAQTIWKGWFVLMILVEGYELAQTIASLK